MCGIVGALVFDGSAFTITAPYLTRMRDMMAHRGPDGAGIWIGGDRRIGLGHRRLSIIDLSSAAGQPMSNEDDTLWISFNGEIYNHAEVRAELERIGGHCWKTDHSDTEVILHAFEQWGIDCLDRLRGMFAIAVWDVRSRELWLIRDRIGIKPLYYSVHHNRLTFASEIKALLADPDQPHAVNEEAFYHYLSFLTTPAPDTLLAGIRKLPNGSWLRVREDGSVREHRYWDVWNHVAPLTGVSDADIAEQILAELRTTVALHKESDVPVGVFLSGGIDSSTNAALFADGEGSVVKTFSIGYDQEYKSYKSELSYARLMARQIGAAHHERVLSLGDLIDFLPEMVRLQDEPIADPVCVPVYYVSKLARANGVVVCQVGEGADELFWGYPGWKSSLQMQRFADLLVPPVLNRTILAGLQLVGKGDGTRYELLRRGTMDQPVFWGGAEGFNEAQKRRILSPRLRKRFASLTSWEVLRPIRERFERQAWDQAPLNWMSYLDLNFRLPELLLMRVDKMSMGVSLEARVPFLDHKFVELAMGIPAQVKTRHGILKYILKKAVRGVIPDELIDRKKQGFGVPVQDWYLGGLRERMGCEIEGLCDQVDLLDRAEVRRLIARGRGQQLWYLLNLAMWWKTYIA